MLDFRDQFFYFLDKIDKGENFSISRYGDGEKMLIEGRDVTECSQARAQDKRKSVGMTKLGEALGKTLDVVDKNYYYAIPCSCCNNKGKIRYMDNVKSHYFTYANLFINNNYQFFREWLKLLTRSVIVMANYEGQDKEYPFTVKQFIPVGDDCANYFERHHKAFINKCKKLAKENKNQLFFISAGPLANIVVYEMYKQNPNNTYIDVGSALDEFTKGRITRGFQRREDVYAQRYCIF